MANFLNAVNKYRRARWCYTHGLKPIAKAYEMLIYLVHNSFVPASCELGGGVLFLATRALALWFTSGRKWVAIA